MTDNYAADALALRRQAFDVRTKEDLDLPGQQRGIQPRGERISEMQRRAARAAQALPRILRNQPRRAKSRAQRFSDPPQMRDIEAVDHHSAEQRELPQRRAPPPGKPAQLPAVEDEPPQEPPTPRPPPTPPVIIPPSPY